MIPRLSEKQVCSVKDFIHTDPHLSLNIPPEHPSTTVPKTRPADTATSFTHPGYGGAIEWHDGNSPLEGLPARCYGADVAVGGLGSSGYDGVLCMECRRVLVYSAISYHGARNGDRKGGMRAIQVVGCSQFTLPWYQTLEDLSPPRVSPEAVTSTPRTEQDLPRWDCSRIVAWKGQLGVHEGFLFLPVNTLCRTA